MLTRSMILHSTLIPIQLKEKYYKIISSESTQFYYICSNYISNINVNTENKKKKEKEKWNYQVKEEEEKQKEKMKEKVKVNEKVSTNKHKNKYETQKLQFTQCIFSYHWIIILSGTM